MCGVQRLCDRLQPNPVEQSAHARDSGTVSMNKWLSSGVAGNGIGVAMRLGSGRLSWAQRLKSVALRR